MRSTHAGNSTVVDVLAAAAVHTLYGAPLNGLPVTPAEDAVAPLLAAAHAAVHHRKAAAVTATGSIEVPGCTAESPESVDVEAGSDPDLLAKRIRAASLLGGIRVKLQVDPLEPLAPFPVSGEGEDPWISDVAELSERIRSAPSVVVIAGPGVVHAGAVPGLHALALTLGAGVLNTWGAKGVFHWRSRHHWATVGLQEHDFALAGVREAGLIIVTGLDERETPPEAWTNAPHVVVAPETLGALAEAVPPRPGPLEMPPLRALLAAVTQAGWESESAPLAPSRVTMHYARRLEGGGLLAADAGESGFCVARTFATTRLGAVSVPPEIRTGWAAACVTVARLAEPLRPALAVLDGGIDEATAGVIDFAGSRGTGFGVEVWTPDGEHLDADGHQARLQGLARPGNREVASVATDPAQIDDFVRAAGPVRAWRRGGASNRPDI